MRSSSWSQKCRLCAFALTCRQCSPTQRQWGGSRSTRPGRSACVQLHPSRPIWARWSGGECTSPRARSDPVNVQRFLLLSARWGHTTKQCNQTDLIIRNVFLGTHRRQLFFTERVEYEHLHFSTHWYQCRVLNEAIKQYRITSIFFFFSTDVLLFENIPQHVFLEDGTTFTNVTAVQIQIWKMLRDIHMRSAAAHVLEVRVKCSTLGFGASLIFSMYL